MHSEVSGFQTVMGPVSYQTHAVRLQAERSRTAEWLAVRSLHLTGAGEPPITQTAPDKEVTDKTTPEKERVQTVAQADQGGGREVSDVFDDTNGGGIPLSFLTQKSVQEDLKMTDEQVKTADAAFKKHSEAVQHLAGQRFRERTTRFQKQQELSKEACGRLKVDQSPRSSTSARSYRRD
jgi:hypothetical protein